VIDEIAENITNGNLSDARAMILGSERPAVEALWTALCLQDRYDVPIDRAVMRLIRLLEN
jgi:hypothetical protein